MITREERIEMLKKKSTYGCMKFINLDSEFKSLTDCTVLCTKCNTVFKHYTAGSGILSGRNTQCSACKSAHFTKLVGKEFKTADGVTCRCISYEKGKFSLKDLDNGFVREISNRYTDFSKIKFYSSLTLEDYKRLYEGRIITSKDNVKVLVESIDKGEGKFFSATFKNIQTGEIKKYSKGSAALKKGFTFYHNETRLERKGTVAYNKDGFKLKVLENQDRGCKVLFMDGATASFKTAFYSSDAKCSYSHPNLSMSRCGKYFNYTLEGIVFRLTNPEDVYYKCKKDGSDEYEILRPCDIDEMHKE